jgi:hypothetical protein
MLSSTITSSRTGALLRSYLCRELSALAGTSARHE